MDDSGFFSIQVISNALKVWGLELILFNSPEYQRLRIDPINEKSFIYAITKSTGLQLEN